MSLQNVRYTAASPLSLAEGWSLKRLTQPSRLFGANGLRTGPDGRIYVAQVSGSQISAIDVETGAIDVISPKGGDIVGPDDLVFDPEGNLYATEITEGRVSVRAPNGTTRVLQGDMPVANPITFPPGTVDCRRVPARRAHHGARPQWRRSADYCQGRADGQCFFGGTGRQALLPGDGDQRDLARQPRGRRAGNSGWGSWCTGLRQVRCAGLYHLDPGAQRSGAADRSTHRRSGPCWRSSRPVWTTRPSSARGCSSRISRGTSPRYSRAARPRTSCPMA